MTLLELAYQRGTLRKEAVELLDKAVIESRSLTIAEQVRFDSLATRMNEMDAAINQRESLRKLVS